MEINNQSKFSYFDYGLFFLMLLFSAFIGFYYACKDRHKKTVDRVLLGGRKLKIFPVAMSIMASFTSAISILGFANEMYQFGSMYLLIGVSYFITQPFAAFFYVPFFHRLRITSAYEYLERRFNNAVRLVASTIFCIEMFLYMAVVLYSPSLAIEQVTGIPLWLSILSTGLVCTVYTSLGGMKAVVFTDTFQSLVMFSGLILIIILGSIQVGGVDIIYDRLVQGGRLEFLDFNPSPFIRHTFWSIMIGGFFTSLTVYGSNQATIQRYLTLPTIRDAQIAMLVNLLGTFAILVLCCFCGFVAYAYYFTCDPLKIGLITKYDQILPFFVVDLFENFYGLPGIFIACIYSAALSTVSSGLNSLSAVFLHDFIYPLNFYFKNEHLSHRKSIIITNCLAGIFGIVTIGLSFLCQYFGSTVLQLSLSIFGILGGPLLGVITLGMLVPFANSYGALSGLLISTCVNLWLGLVTILYGNRPQAKDFKVDGCPLNSTFIPITNRTVVPNEGFRMIYNLSYYWFSLIAIVIVFVVGISVSLITNREKKKVNEELLIHLRDLIPSRKNDPENNDLDEKLKMVDF
ncbi:unnamed protein product [Brachionus calyciflorus]|uniref:Sodium-coupled monocarboxylate transporter 1 n=1 Tax=Brachionus calyciflorus TaxID=104777 RepID=A0A814AYQ6_9BILA|nr:unnamed protein product [Brachionus calyciflorus]